MIHLHGTNFHTCCSACRCIHPRQRCQWFSTLQDCLVYQRHNFHHRLSPIDVGITYSEVAEKIAFNQGITTSSGYYAFRDHFLLVGPPSNPANISKTADILTIFSQLRAAADAAVTELPVRFLSRYDKSATNIKESSLWIGI